MAVIGARPATGPWIFGRRTRSRVQSRPRRTTRARIYVGAGRRVRQQVEIRGLLIAIAAAAALAFFYLSQSTHVAATGYEIDRLESILADRRAEGQSLIWQIGQARSPATIDQRARDDLRLVPLETDAVRFAPLAADTAD